jgi:NAD(P)H dehydrogenase (quinone)
MLAPLLRASLIDRNRTRRNIMFTILGATGKIGGTAARELRTHGKAVRAVVRDASKAEQLRHLGCEIAIAEYHDASTLSEALSGSTTVLALCPVNPRAADAMADHGQMIEAIAAAVDKTTPGAVVAISDYGAHEELEGSVTSIFRMLEQRLRAVSPSTTILRSAEHMQNWSRLLSGVAKSGVLPLFYRPATRTFPLVSALDVGRMAAGLLLEAERGSPSRIVHAEGPIRYSTTDVLEAIRQATNRKVSPMAVPEENWLAALTSAGLSESYASLVAGMYAANNAGRIEVEPNSGEARLGTTSLLEAFAALR